MYTVNVVHRHPWTGRIIWQSSVAKALQGPLQNFGNISVFLPASDSARAQGVAIGLAPCEFSRFSGRYPAGIWHLAQNARSLGMLTTLRVIWRCIGSRPNCWLWSMLSSLTAGSNFMIPTLMGIRIELLLRNVARS